MIAQVRNTLFYLLIAVVLLLCALLAERWNASSSWRLDLSSYGHNSPSTETRALLEQLETPIGITAYLADHPVQRKQIEDLVERLRQTGARIELDFVDPGRNPDQARAAGVRHSGSLQITFEGRKERVNQATEAQVFAALARLSRQGSPWIVSLSGQGERRLDGNAPADLGRFGALLEQRGYQVLTLALGDTPQLPDNSALVILAAPRRALGPAEMQGLNSWLDQGGSLLWLDEGQALPALSERLGIKQLPGVVVDAMAAPLGYDSPDMAVAARHPDHPVTAQLKAPVVLPGARAWQTLEESSWQVQRLLQSSPKSWNETSALRGRLKRDAEQQEQAGPLTLGLGLSRALSQPGRGQQRLAVLGDADLLSNAALGEQANRDFGLALVHWLTDQALLTRVPPKQARDARLNWSMRTATLVVGLTLVAMPLVLLATGLRIRHVRNRA